MEDINTIEELKEALALSADSNVEDDWFKRIADFLIGHCAIKKGDEVYYMSDIEFYFFNKNHRDIITHPRKCEALEWYVNDFGGIDLTFKSEVRYERFKNSSGKYVEKPVLTEDSYFGGILLRGLRKDSGECLTGPYACAEIFRRHNAIVDDSDFPVLIMGETGLSIGLPVERYNLIKKNASETDREKKVKNILYNYGNGKRDIEGNIMPDFPFQNFEKDFETFEKKLFRFAVDGPKQK